MRIRKGDRTFNRLVCFNHAREDAGTGTLWVWRDLSWKIKFQYQRLLRKDERCDIPNSMECKRSESSRTFGLFSSFPWTWGWINSIYGFCRESWTFKYAKNPSTVYIVAISCCPAQMAEHFGKRAIQDGTINHLDAVSDDQACRA